MRKQQPKPMAVQVTNYSEWLQVGQDDDKTEQLVIAPVELVELSSALTSKLAKHNRLTQLTLNGCHLIELAGLPKLPCLLMLNLNDNRIRGKQLVNLAGFDVLMVLCLANNLIALVDELEPLNSNPCLFQLELKGNPIRGTHDYRQLVFDRLKTLNVLDRKTVCGRKLEFACVKKSRSQDAEENKRKELLSTINEEADHTLENHGMTPASSRKKIKVVRPE